VVTTVRVQPDVCIGAGQCVLAAPTVFDQDELDGIVILLNEHPVDGEVDETRAAARRCPVRAIQVEDDGTA
jgi:ferredoxin